MKDAPKIDTDGHLSPQEEQELYRYYGMGAGTDTGADRRPTPARPTTGPPAPAATDTDDRRERARHRRPRHLRPDDRRRHDPLRGAPERRHHLARRSAAPGCASTSSRENVTETVPVSREEVRVEREPITDANVGNAMDGPAISEEEHEVTLHAERPVVEKEAVPVERVRLDKETVTEQEQVSETVRKEQIEVDGVGTRPRRPPRDRNRRI